MLSALAICERLYRLIDDGSVTGFDTEGTSWMTCCGFATHHPGEQQPWRCLVVDTLGLRGQPHAKDVHRAIRAVLESDRVTKVCWNAAHERAFLQLCHQVTLTRYEDAMFAWHERFPELPKGLKYAASLLTRLPCWTHGISWSDDDDRPAASGEQLWRYNAYDCVATLQLWLNPQLRFAYAPVNAAEQSMQRRYAANLHLIEPFNYASQKGVLYDHAAAQTIRDDLTPKLWEAQAAVDEAAGITLPTGDALLEYVKAHCCKKASVKKGLVTDWPTAQVHALKDYAEPLARCAALLGSELAKAAQGEIASLLDIGLNVKSTPAVLATLNRLGLPPVYKRRKSVAGEDNEDDAAVQTKEAAALLAVYLRRPHPILTALLTTIALRGRLQEFRRGVDDDGRIRSSYIICGPSTDRTASHKWLTGGGGNVQTVPREPVNFRVCYCADPGHDWYKLDLTGADLWTVACRVAAEGDRTLLDDLLAGIRVPSLVGLLMEGYKPSSDRSRIKADCVAYRASLKQHGEGWRDTVWKKASHLTNYGGSPKRIRQSVIEDTYAETGSPIDPGLALCEQVQRLYLQRYYGIRQWWARTASTIVRTGKLVYATGREREFLGRRVRSGTLDDVTKREALAAEPQHNTTFIIKTGLLRLWNDPDNWPSGSVGCGDPIAQPLIPNVHDEANWQAPVERRAWIAAKLHQWFDVPLTIGRDCVTIPWEAGYGPNWGDAKQPIDFASAATP